MLIMGVRSNSISDADSEGGRFLTKEGRAMKRAYFFPAKSFFSR